jgi:phosphoglycolate phosphatase
MIRLCIFDLDGTLADTLADIGGAMNRALTTLGLPTHPLAAYRDFVGEGVDVLARRALGSAPPARLAELTQAYVAAYAANLIDASAPYPGVPDLLDTLVDRHFGLAVLSNKPDDATQRVCAELFGRWAFVGVAGARAGVPKKPDPTAALALAAAAGCAPAECAFIGDTAIDMRTALAAGMAPIGVGWGFRPEELVAAGARGVAATPEDVLALL